MKELIILISLKLKTELRKNFKRMRKEATDEKIFAKDTSGKELLSKIFKEFL